MNVGMLLHAESLGCFIRNEILNKCLDGEKAFLRKAKSPPAGVGFLLGCIGGGGRDRTGVDGFAGRCITTLLPRRGSRIVPAKPGICSGFARLWQAGFVNKKGKRFKLPFRIRGAGEESRTLDLNLGKVALYQLSYSRVKQKRDYKGTRHSVKYAC